MIKKLKVRFVANDAAEALVGAQVVFERVRKWPNGLERPETALRAHLDAFEAEHDKIMKAMSVLEDDTFHLFVGEEELEDHVVPLYEVETDLSELFEDEDEARREGALLLELLFIAKDLAFFEVEVIAGKKRSTIAKAMAAVREAARTHRVRLPTTDELRDGEEAFDQDEDEDDEDEVDAEFDSSSRERPKGKKRGRAANEWGDWNDAGATASHAGGTALTEAEQFFLNYAALSWPCTPADLKAAYYRVAHETHPDKSQAPGAAHRFALLKQGYESLLSRLMARAAE